MAVVIELNSARRREFSLVGIGRSLLTRILPGRLREEHESTQQLAEVRDVLKNDFFGLTELLVGRHGKADFDMYGIPELQFGSVWLHYKNLPLPAKINVECHEIDALLDIKRGPYNLMIHMVGNRLIVDEQYPEHSKVPQLRDTDRARQDIAWLRFANELLTLVAQDVIEGKPPSHPPA